MFSRTLVTLVAGALACSAANGQVLNPAMGQPRMDMKRGNPLFVASPQGGLWRPDSVQPLDIPDGFEPQALRVEVELGGVMRTLSLTPRESALARAVIIVDRGTEGMERYHPSPSSVYGGVVEGVADSSVSATVRNGKLNATVSLPNATWFVQPAADFAVGGEPGAHMVWSNTNQPPLPHNTCGEEDEHAAEPRQPEHGALDRYFNKGIAVRQQSPTNLEPGERQGGAPGGGGGGGGGYGPRAPWDGLLAIDVDCHLYNNYDDVQDTVDFVDDIMSNVNSRYSGTFGFTHLITYVVVRTSCGNDPYSTDNASTLLAQFGGNWNTTYAGVPRNMVILFTGRGLEGSTIGLAHTSTACDGSDRRGDYCLIEADWCLPFQGRATVAKHEIGHCWGSHHDSCGAFNCDIMCPGIDLTCTSTNSSFSGRSQDEIRAYRNTVACNIHSGNDYYVYQWSPYAYPTGNADHPYQSLIDGYNTAAWGGGLRITPAGVYNTGHVFLNKQLTVRSTAGLVQIR